MEIPVFARIIGVADAFDAMTANRVYRKQMDFSYVLGELERGRGTQFDPQYVDILLQLIREGTIDLNEVYHVPPKNPEEEKDGKDTPDGKAEGGQEKAAETPAPKPGPAGEAAKGEEIKKDGTENGEAAKQGGNA